VVLKQPDHVLPGGSTATVLFAVPQDPEGATSFTAPATGYTLGYNSDYYMVTALTHSWTQTAGPVTAMITNGSTLRPTVSGLTTAGTYTFRYSGTDQQGDVTTSDINVVTQTSANTLTVYAANVNHGQGTDGNFGFSRQVTAMADADIIAVQERTTTETGWDSLLAAAGLTQAVYMADPAGGDGQALWIRSATVTVNTTYTQALANSANPTSGSTTFGWDGSTDCRRSVAAAKVTAASQQFYVVSVHLGPSRCNDASGVLTSVMRESQITNLKNWITATLTGGLPVVVLGDFNLTPDQPKTGGGTQLDLMTSAYTDLWQAGLTAGTASANWGDRDGDGIADMPLGSLTTRTHDTRARIDYAFVTAGATTVTLSGISVPDGRATCSVALTNIQGNQCTSCGSTYKECPDVAAPGSVWDVPDDQGVRASDHNLVRAVLTLSAAPTTHCRWSTETRCQ
jgi:endonuclease/exonuclease/phosphatase family metal-dependent hydrolase